MRHCLSNPLRSATLVLVTASLFACSSKPLQNTTTLAHASNPAAQQPSTRPTTAPPPFKLFHQSSTSITLITSPTATDVQIVAILWQLRDAAQTHTFDTLHIPQKVVDARDPYLWFHLYRGPKCASEKYADGQPPCGPSYHAAGDFTLGGFHDPNWTSGSLLTPTATGGPHETQLWPPGSAYTRPTNH